jgi:hypothetical protein
MTCTPQDHTCWWGSRPATVERILARYLAGTSEQALATEHALNIPEIIAIVTAHGVPVRPSGARWERLGTRSRECRPGAHHCLWADCGDVVDELIGAYAQGASINELSRTLPYSRATADRILKAHDVPRRSRSEQCTRIQLDLDAIQRSLDDGVPLSRIADAHQLSRQWLRVRLERAREAA